MASLVAIFKTFNSIPKEQGFSKGQGRAPIPRAPLSSPTERPALLLGGQRTAAGRLAGHSGHGPMGAAAGNEPGPGPDPQESNTFGACEWSASGPVKEPSTKGLLGTEVHLPVGFKCVPPRAESAHSQPGLGSRLSLGWQAGVPANRCATVVGRLGGGRRAGADRLLIPVQRATAIVTHLLPEQCVTLKSRALGPETGVPVMATPLPTNVGSGQGHAWQGQGCPGLSQESRGQSTEALLPEALRWP